MRYRLFEIAKKILTDLFVVLTTEENASHADYLANELLNRRLAACISMRNVRSKFWWEGEIQHSKEVQLLIKTTKDRLVNLVEAIEQLHSYSTPEILYWETSSSFPYGKWVEDSVVDS